MDILGYIAALIIGTLLGLLGGGGSILTVPVLVYIFGIVPVTATAYSLFIVGFSSLIGAFVAYRKKQLAIDTAIKFGIPSIISVYLTRQFIVPAIPQTIIETAYYTLNKNSLIMLLFAILMIAASVSMIRNTVIENSDAKINSGKSLIIILDGLIVGALTGLVGAGGGFLIIPALVILLRVPMKIAVGTSLAIIAAKSLIGFLGDLSTQQIDWKFLSLFSALSLIGILIGSSLTQVINGDKLKKGFGWFVLISGIIILLNEIIGWSVLFLSIIILLKEII